MSFAFGDIESATQFLFREWVEFLESKRGHREIGACLASASDVVEHLSAAEGDGPDSFGVQIDGVGENRSEMTRCEVVQGGGGRSGA